MPGVLMLFDKHVLAAVGLLVLLVLGSHANVWPGHVEYPLELLDGTDGFRITADASDGRLGYSVSAAGDVNNDGFQDVILGESPASSSIAGAAYVVFGSEIFSAIELDISALDGTNGFKIEGTDAGDYAGTAVAGAGDVNGDGFDDVMVGGWGASSAAGEILVVFGAEEFSAVVVAGDLDGSRGFLVRGATTSDAAGFDLAAAGDVNGDGAADMLIGAYQADPSGSMSGKAYVVFGSADWTAGAVDLAELGVGGLTFEGSAQRSYLGHSVAGAGDVNDDGYSDVIVSAYGADEAYVFYGASTFSSSSYELNTLSGIDGFVVSTGSDGDALVVAAAGDLNGDGYGDVAIGHPLADPSSDNSAGAVHVIFGGASMPSSIGVLIDLDGSNGFTLEGASAGDRSGTSISGAGDINQDGFEDILVGAPGVGTDAGSAYVVFGGAEFAAASYTLGSLGAADGFVLNAPSDNGYGGFSVAGTGDINQDGFPDLIVGAYGSGTAGEAFVVFPHLTGTPPPTASPIASPVGGGGPTPSLTLTPTSLVPSPPPTLAPGAVGPTPSPTQTPIDPTPSTTFTPSTPAPSFAPAPIGPTPFPVTPAPLGPTHLPTLTPAGSAPTLVPASVTATPSPSSSPVVGIVGPMTSAPLSPATGAGAATPAPTTSFLSAGVVGRGTVYDSPGVFVQAEELGGMVSLGEDQSFDEDTRVSIALESLQEKSAEGSLVGLGAATPHVVNGGGLVYEASATTNVSVGGVAAHEAAMTTTVLGGASTITITMQVFEEAGMITNGDEQIYVTTGELKFSISVSNWPFCDPATEPTDNSSSSNQDTPSTVCPGASSTLEDGAYLDAVLVVQGPSSSTPILQEGETTTNGGGGGEMATGGGLKYCMSGGSADGTLVMSEWVKTDDYGWAKAEKIALSDSSFTVRFPASSGTLYYDPTLELILTPGGRIGFWRHAWFIWVASVLAVSVAICLLCFIAHRRSWLQKEKVSPRFEGVAPAVDASVGSDRNSENYGGVFTCFRNRSRRDTPRGRRKRPSITRRAAVGVEPPVAGGGDEGGSGSAAAGDHNTATPAPSEGATAVDAAATPDYTKSLNGTLCDGANADTATEAYDGGHSYDQEHDGYEGYPGYADYRGYERYGYDGYGYDGYYYDPGYYWQGAASANEVTNNSSPLAAAPSLRASPSSPSAAPVTGSGDDLRSSPLEEATSLTNVRKEREMGAPVARGGADLRGSPLEKTASPMNARKEQEIRGEGGGGGVERQTRSVGRGGTGAGAVRLLPIVVVVGGGGGVTRAGGTLPPRPASR